MCRFLSYLFFFFKQKTAYEIMPSLVGSEMCIRDRQVVLALVFGHESAFDKRCQCERVVIVHTKTFPSVFFGMKQQHVFYFADGVEVACVNFYTLSLIHI
eukprot:TRINITY_DN10600_c0_g1_i1.p1 TRINITY_DN10600_c0_g1~~TRINITY_DN10600_c0_g1_i1.p1  ORF type:complete len:100 (-),score=0.09 TRINITY_DN10600_c0_g1_i1:79-378(-)